MEDAGTRYIVVDVFDHIGGNSASLGELEVYNIDGNKINYTVLDSYDSASDGIPAYWNKNNMYWNWWSYEKLYDGKISYTSNEEGGYNCALFFFGNVSSGTYPNSGYWARFVVDLGSYQNIKDIKIAIGNSENRIPKSISTYRVSNYVAGKEEGSTYKKNICTRSNEGLILTHTQEFTDIITTPTWYSFMN